MSEFLDYKVELTLSDGVKYIGIITHVDSRQITLSNVIKSTSPQELLAVFQVESSQIKDLKVIQLPQNLRTQLGKSSKKKGTNTRQNGASILDDAIVFAQAATPPLASVLIPPVSSNYGTPRNSSRTNTPQLSSVRANYQSSIASGGDTDWNNEVKKSNLPTSLISLPTWPCSTRNRYLQTSKRKIQSTPTIVWWATTN